MVQRPAAFARRRLGPIGLVPKVPTAARTGGGILERDNGVLESIISNGGTNRIFDKTNALTSSFVDLDRSTIGPAVLSTSVVGTTRLAVENRSTKTAFVGAPSLNPTGRLRIIASGLRVIVAIAGIVSLSGVSAQGVDRQRSFKAGGHRKRPVRLPAALMQPPVDRFEVQPVTAEGREVALRMAGAIDVAAKSSGAAVNLAAKPAGESIDEATFLRRVYLDVAGRIPTLAEIRRFDDDDSPEKRLDLIDRLLSSRDYVSHFYNLWADTLRLHERPSNNIVATPYLTYVRDTIAANVPYDAWVREMLTADGKIWNNPATGYQLRDDGMPLPYVDNTVRVFLGTQIGCAQCHDHPFDDWSQRQFYQLAALTAPATTRFREPAKSRKSPRGNPAKRLIDHAKSQYGTTRIPGSFTRLVRSNTYRVGVLPRRRLRLPHDYAYDDAEPNQTVQPRLLWDDATATSTEGDDNADGRQRLARWMTSRSNDRFAMTIANRLWKHVIGVGIVEPIDDFRDDNPPSNPPLLSVLADQVREVDYDLKQFLRGILYSHTYQSPAVAYDITSGQPHDASSPIVRRMSGEQVWDSLLTLAARETMPYVRPSADEFREAFDLDLTTVSYDRALHQSERLAETMMPAARRRSIAPYLYRGRLLTRASELPSPLPDDHFLRQFGVSDRSVIDAGDDTATVPQILAMFNGPITHVMLEPGSKLVEDVLAVDDHRQRIDDIFRAILTRSPTPQQRRIAMSAFEGRSGAMAGYGDLIWALLNTREFLFVQ